MRRGNRPAILTVGHVIEHDDVVVITGWEIGLCAAACTCHRHPETGLLAVAPDTGYGKLGLARYRLCRCCSPWTHGELAAVVRDIADLAALAHTAPPPTS